MLEGLNLFLAAASIVAVCANVYKQNMIFPAPTAATGENKNQSTQLETPACSKRKSAHR